MDSKPGVMCLSENLLSQGLILRNANPTTDQKLISTLRLHNMTHQIRLSDQIKQAYSGRTQNHMQVKILQHLECLLTTRNHTAKGGIGLPAQSISYNISFTLKVLYSEVIVFQELYPSALAQIQITLRKNVLQTLVISVDLETLTIEVTPPQLQYKNNCT